MDRKILCLIILFGYFHTSSGQETTPGAPTPTTLNTTFPATDGRPAPNGLSSLAHVQIRMTSLGDVSGANITILVQQFLRRQLGDTFSAINVTRIRRVRIIDIRNITNSSQIFIPQSPGTVVAA